jgi:XTP/dITP diphosphohydrolase
MTDHILVLGTHNQKKRLELELLLAPLGLTLRTLDEFPDALDVEETGTTFSENAALKAAEQAQHLGHWVLGEDSGLSVAPLGNAPGVYSARYSEREGQAATDESNNEKLLAELGDLPLAQRIAFYTCHMAISDPTGKIRLCCEEVCYGRIRFSPAGSNGFGYDPLFEIAEYHRTFGELGSAIKSVLSHRSRAMRKVVPDIKALLAAGQL